ncbi:MAG: hypothetical protein WCT45_00020 [Candidatus Paceibacterota bacterium]|jgi:hypothetical protein
MSFLENFFPTKKVAESVVLIDVGEESVAGAYARCERGKTPVIVYTRSVPIRRRQLESLDIAMLRALRALGDRLVREGAPALARATGSGAISRVLVSVDAPWQESTIRTEHFEDSGPFVCTRELAERRLGDMREAVGEMLDMTLTDQSIVGAVLNGYETREPYDKKASRASLTVLSSLVIRDIAESITTLLEGLYHTKDVELISGSSLRYQVMSRLFPHERDALIVDATASSLTSVGLMRKGVLAALLQVSVPDDVSGWLTALQGELAEMSKHYALPSMVFLLAREPAAPELRRALETARLGVSRPTKDTPKIVLVTRSNIGGAVRHREAHEADISILFMALYLGHRGTGISL